MKTLRLFLLTFFLTWATLVSAEAAVGDIDFTQKSVYAVVDSNKKIDIVVVVPVNGNSTEALSAELQMDGRTYNTTFTQGINTANSVLSNLGIIWSSDDIVAVFDANIDILTSYALRIRTSDLGIVNLSGAVVNRGTNVLPKRYIMLDNISVPVPTTMVTPTTPTVTPTTTVVPTTTNGVVTPVQSSSLFTKNYKDRFKYKSRAEEPNRINGIGNNPNYKSWDANSPR